MSYLEETGNPTSIQMKLLDLETALDSFHKVNGLLSGGNEEREPFIAIIQSIWEEENDNQAKIPNPAHSSTKSEDIVGESVVHG